MLKMIEGPSLPLYARYILIAVLVIWFSLAGGSWFGRALIAQEVFGEAEDQVEFRSMPEPRARPWVQVDPELEKEMELLRRSAGPGLAQSAAVRQPAAELTPEAETEEGEVESTVIVAAPEAASLVPPGSYLLQFGAFSDEGNATRLKDQLSAAGHSVKIERMESRSGGTLYRVKGPVFEDPEEAERQARSLRTQGFQVFVVGE